LVAVRANSLVKIATLRALLWLLVDEIIDAFKARTLVKIINQIGAMRQNARGSLGVARAETLSIIGRNGGEDTLLNVMARVNSAKPGGTTLCRRTREVLPVASKTCIPLSLLKTVLPCRSMERKRSS
jgi:hypothetical protein